jgi:hypothetical protein
MLPVCFVYICTMPISGFKQYTNGPVVMHEMGMHYTGGYAIYQWPGGYELILYSVKMTQIHFLNIYTGYMNI